MINKAFFHINRNVSANTFAKTRIDSLSGHVLNKTKNKLNLSEVGRGSCVDECVRIKFSTVRQLLCWSHVEGAHCG